MGACASDTVPPFFHFQPRLDAHKIHRDYLDDTGLPNVFDITLMGVPASWLVVYNIN
jgi:hypothetical protein